MGPAERVALGIVVVAGITTLVLPDRLTVRIFQTGVNGFIGSLRASMGR